MNVMLLEFNELSPRLMEAFIAAGHLPNFKRLRAESNCFITDACEVPPNLEPWIQWVTVHTGMPFKEHKCFHLNDGGALSARRIWDEVGAAGGKSWVCGSMNAAFDYTSFRGHFLPDPWATDVPDYPNSYFAPFINVVRPFVQEHSGRPKVSPLAIARFSKFMLQNGLSLSTIQATISQLISEKKNMTKWRRALILDRLLWDLFRSIYIRERPNFSSFFINSTAHFQHFHWREMEPDIFKIKPSDLDLHVYGGAILDGYKNMDRIVGDALAIAGSDTAVVLCTALSQQPMLTYEHSKGRQIFRHRDIKRLLEFADVHEDYEYVPVMSQQFNLLCQSEAEATRVASKLEALTLDDGTQIMWAYPIGEKVDAGCKITEDPGALLIKKINGNAALPFHDLFYPLESLRSGMHSSEGLLWIKTEGQPGTETAAKVPLLSVFPTLIQLLDLSVESPHASSLLVEREKVMLA